MPSSSTYQPQVSTFSSPGYETAPHIDLFSYSRVMHQHTKQQMEAASRSARRRSPQSEGSKGHVRLGTEESVESMDTTRS